MLLIKVFHGEDKGGGALRTSVNFANWLREQGHVVEVLTYKIGSLTRSERQLWFEQNISHEDLVILVQPEMLFACFRYFLKHPSVMFSSKKKFCYYMRNDLIEIRNQFSHVKRIAHYFCLLIFAHVVRGRVLTNAFLEYSPFVPINYLANVCHLSTEAFRVGTIDRFVFVNGKNAQKRPDILISKMERFCQQTGMVIHVYGPAIDVSSSFVINHGYQESIDYTKSALLCSSDYEGEPNVFLEAFGQKAPVIYLGTNSRLKTLVCSFYGIASSDGTVDLKQLQSKEIVGMNKIRRQSIIEFSLWIKKVGEKRNHVY